MAEEFAAKIVAAYAAIEAVSEGPASPYHRHEALCSLSSAALQRAAQIDLTSAATAPPAPTSNLTAAEHKARHEELHRALDELLADWIRHAGGLPSESVHALMQWSHQQTIAPTEPAD